MKRILTAATLLGGALAATAATPATYPGGEEALQIYLKENVTYPQFARDNGIEGTVTVLFTVGIDGSISGARVDRPLDPDLEAEALRLVTSMPLWQPATDDAGMPEATSVSLPVKFRL